MALHLLSAVLCMCGCYMFWLALCQHGTDTSLRQIVNFARQDMRALRDAVLLLEQRMPTAAKNIPVAIQSLNRRMERTELAIGSLGDNLRDVHTALTECEQRLAAIVDTAEETVNDTRQDDSRRELITAREAAAATAEIAPDAVCGNCGKPYKDHYHEDADYCNDQTNGDVFTSEPNADELIDHFSRTNPEDFRQLAEAWRQANGHR